MRKQKDMEDAMIHAHKNFMGNLEKSLDILDAELKEAMEMSGKCTDEWCSVTESFIDDLHKNLFSISEPRWLPLEESHRLKKLRARIRELYRTFAHLQKGNS